jgi:hypothetical protein
LWPSGLHPAQMKKKFRVTRTKSELEGVLKRRAAHGKGKAQNREKRRELNLQIPARTRAEKEQQCTDSFLVVQPSDGPGDSRGNATHWPNRDDARQRWPLSRRRAARPAPAILRVGERSYVCSCRQPASDRKNRPDYTSMWTVTKGLSASGPKTVTPRG